MRTGVHLIRKPAPAEDAGVGGPKAIAEYLVLLGDDLRSGRKWSWETVSYRATNLKHRAILPMNWNRMHILSREEICFGAAVSVKPAREQWEQLEPWLQFLLAESTLIRTRGRVAVRGDQPAAWERNDTP